MKPSKKTDEANSFGEYNPFVKPGDIICLRNKSGKYKVINASTDNLKLRPASKETEEDVQIFCSWSDFAGWRSR